MTYKVSFMIIVNTNEDFCESIETFNKLLELNSAIKVKKDFIEYDKKILIGYVNKSGLTTSKKQRYFQLEFSCDCSEDEIENFSKFLRAVKKIVGNQKLLARPEVLWDDISLYYSEKAYPKIFNIENLLRRLINSFMLKEIGKEWAERSFPEQVRKVAKDDREGTILHQLDFDHLADFLFIPYSRYDSKTIYSKIESARIADEFDEIKVMLPKSNWDRYFAKVIKTESEYLRKKWEDLYKLRCCVAHNGIITKADFETVIKLCDELKNKFEQALEELDKISIPEEEKELVSKNAVNTINSSALDHIKLSLTTSMGDVGKTSGLNWGQREGREANQAYLPVPASIGITDFFPPNGKYFKLLTDDGLLFECVRSQSNGKAIETPNDHTLLGKYFRKRLGLEEGALVTTNDLLKYGRTDIDIYKIDDSEYFLDFSNE